MVVGEDCEEKQLIRSQYIQLVFGTDFMLYLRNSEKQLRTLRKKMGIESNKPSFKGGWEISSPD